MALDRQLKTTEAKFSVCWPPRAKLETHKKSVRSSALNKKVMAKIQKNFTLQHIRNLNLKL